MAAGRGTRLSNLENTQPKQYLKLAGQSILAHTLSVFQSSEVIDHIQVVIHPEDEDLYLKNSSDIGKLLPPIFGGATRQESVFKGLTAISDLNPTNVYIHDAARPFLDQYLIENIDRELKKNIAVIPALPLTDTIKKAQEMLVEKTIDRATLYAVQTPQGFNFEEIFSAHEKAENSTGSTFTDDASIMEWLGKPVKLIPGSKNNFKITTLEDLKIAERQIQNMTETSYEYRTGQGFDVHAFTNGDHVIMFGVKIPHTKSLKGHSDADVAMHAVTDALLGSICEGDIGDHFPPTDPQWKGEASETFLRHAMKLIKDRSGIITNVDATIICEAPKLMKHKRSMRKNMADLLDIDISRMSVKATTSERLGFTGRGEGIACIANATVKLPEA